MKIQLNSTNTFTVYKDLSFVDKSIDVTNAKIVAADNLLRVYPTFIETGVKIRKGTHSYDKEILSWATVRSFIKKGIIKPINFNFEETIAAMEKEAENALKAEKKANKKSDKKEEVEDKVADEAIKTETKSTKKSLAEISK